MSDQKVIRVPRWAYDELVKLREELEQLGRGAIPADMQLLSSQEIFTLGSVSGMAFNTMRKMLRRLLELQGKTAGLVEPIAEPLAEPKRKKKE